jgi:hypothetical protein
VTCQLVHIEELCKKQSRLASAFQLRIRLLWSVKRVITYLLTRLIWVAQGRKGPSACPAEAELQAGDLVRVRSEEEIRKTLDPWGECKRCVFVPEMYQYCNKTYRVFKNVSNFYDEVKQRMCRCRGVVVLTGVTCSGERRALPNACDRNCFLFWQTAWLEKIEDVGDPGGI